MNANYCSTITLYNRIRSADNGGTESWNRTILTDCFYKSKTVTGWDGTKAAVSNTYTVRIPENEAYVPYADYVSSPDGHFTASLDDIVILGECTDEITGKSGATATEILRKHKPDAFKVTAFSDNTAFAAAKHYRLEG